MIKKLISFTIHAHLLLAISAFVFSYGILKFEPNQFEFSISLALAVYGIYNFHRLIKLKNNELPQEMKGWYEQHQLFLQYSSVISLLISAILYLKLLKLYHFSYLILIVSCLITVFYIRKHNKFNLRLIPLTKSFWVAIVWTLIAVVMPKTASSSFQFSDLIFFLLFFALTLPGDIRDCETDRPQMKTIPQLIGKRNAEILFVVFLTTFLFLKYPLDKGFLIIFLSITIFSFILFRRRFLFRFELMDALLFWVGVSLIVCSK